ncbi:predicted protein [Streptomyces albidoflavus]|nr:predicted protein [Streptomyces albidoflavus]
MRVSGGTRPSRRAERHTHRPDRPLEGSMIRQPGSDDSTPTPEELRARVEGTREELGMEVEEAAGKTADVKEQAQAKAAELKETAQAKGAELKAQAQAQVKGAELKGQAQVKGAELKGQAQTRASGAKAQAQVKAAEVLERTPQPVREKAYQVGESARTNVKPLIGFGLAVLAVCVVVSRAGRR